MTCPELGDGLAFAVLTCDREEGHDGDHHCPETGATWHLIAPQPQKTGD